MTTTVQTWPAPAPLTRRGGRPYPHGLDKHRAERARFVAMLHAAGWHPLDIGRAYGISRSTVYADIAKERGGH